MYILKYIRLSSSQRDTPFQIAYVYINQSQQTHTVLYIIRKIVEWKLFERKCNKKHIKIWNNKYIKIGGG